ncbi:MAG: type II secretion system protein [Bacillota bacterium]
MHATRTSSVYPLKGFTLIEILVVIAIISILAAITVIAVNPSRQFKEARDSQRVSNVNAIINAIGQNMADNKGVFTCPDIGTTIDGGTATTSIGTDTGHPDLESCLVPTYLPTMVMDPNGGTNGDTKYKIALWPSGRYAVVATGEITSSIEAVR